MCKRRIKHNCSAVLLLVAFFAIQCTASSNIRLSKASLKFNEFADFCLSSQQSIISTLEKEDGKENFCQDPWDRKNNEGVTSAFGVTAVIQKGNLIEKGAVSTTIATGVLSAERANAISSRRGKGPGNDLINKKYSAAALSLVLHSSSPMVPTFRSDIRYFELENGEGWFGGGADLTPYYLFDEDAKNFHNSYKTVCDSYSDSFYPKYKKWCDEYFYLPARQEHRGVGGIFFDDFEGINDVKNDDSAINLVKNICNNFMPSYIPIVQKRRNLKFSEDQRHWQLLRRGRYIEFNMLYDRGVKFGLVPGGRIEAVMVSCPPLVAWDYNYQLKPDSEEERLVKILKNPIEWV